MKLLIIFNPAANHNTSFKIESKVRKLLQQHDLEYDLMRTDYRGHAITLAAEADFNEYEGIIAVGGDGTVFEVINGYFKNKSEKRIPFGVIPSGTGNSYSLDIYENKPPMNEVIQKISDKNIKYIDVGKFKTQQSTYYFLNILGLGFVADVGKESKKFKFLGNFSYTLAVFTRLLFLKSFKLDIELDGKKVEEDNIFVEISNTKYTANFLMAPDAEIDDGYLDVTLLRSCSRTKLIRSFPKLFTGEHVKMEEVSTFKAKKINIKTDIPKVLTPDGEIMGETPLSVECLHQILPVFYGK